jgi:Phage tail lysozyme
MLIKVAKATDTPRAAATHTAKAKPAPSHTPTAAPSAAATAPSLADASGPDAAAPNAPATRAPAPAPTASQPAAATTVSCDLNSGGLLPENVSAIVSFLLANGYSDNAAAGIAGNMYQESTGNPEAVGDGGGGLIGFTPLPAGYVTGNVSADLQTQLAAVLTYNQIWSSYLPALNSAGSPADAADVYVTDFERAGIPATATRETSAEDVASACGI